MSTADRDPSSTPPPPGETPAAEPAAEASAPVETGVAGSFPIVGIGASAGGLAAFESFFAGLPIDTEPGMAFVLVQHLAPDHDSILPELIGRFTRMRVFEVESGVVVQPNCVYIIPPGRDLSLSNGRLLLLDPALPRGHRMAIDGFFRSLAADQQERAIGVVMSGTGSDGTLGLREIKDQGGMAMVQSPSSTEFDGMPRSALGTGLVDFELPPGEMGKQLIAYAARTFAKASSANERGLPKIELATPTIFALLREHTGHDFSQYKPSTIGRRIERRMAVHQIEEVSEYVKFLQQSAPEVGCLFRDLLIGVTNFFRDPDAFSALERLVVPKLFEAKPLGSTIRAWVPGCSTGEEAYSIAMLLLEHNSAHEGGHSVQVFATDINVASIATARAGVYPASIAADVSPQRLARFFTLEADGTYRVSKGLRDVLIFSEQNLIRDPPFSRLDLISCRNLFIYLNGDLQRTLIPLFHYALNPRGMLFLGTSEGTGDNESSFSVVDRKSKLFQRTGDGTKRRLTHFSSSPVQDSASPRAPARPAEPRKQSLQEITEKTLLQEVVTAGALVNSHGDVLYLHGRSGRFLEPPSGETTTANVLKMAREGLRPGLAKALQDATSSNGVAYATNLRVKTNGGFSRVNVTVRPALMPQKLSDSLLYLVVFEEARAAEEDPSRPGAAAPEGSSSLLGLQEELRAKEEYLASAQSQLAKSTDELRSSNEEMQSVNEELQSTNEELETSKEELQSVNEELSTVNTELQTKVGDLSRANNDLKNLLAGTGIGTVFVDHKLHILRFTPAASALINLIPSDVGRPVAHLVSNLVGYDGLVADARAVLDTLVPKEVTVQTTNGKWYTMRIQPYRTLENIIEGAVISFVDITATKQAQQRLLDGERRYHEILSAATDDIFVVDAAAGITYANRVPSDVDARGAIGSSWLERLDAPERPMAAAAISQTLASGHPTTLELFAVHADRTLGASLQVQLSPLPTPDGDQVVVVVHDISERRGLEARRRRIDELQRSAAVVRDARDAITVQAPDGQTLAWNPAATRMYGWSEAEALAMNVMARIPPELREQTLDVLRRLSLSETLEPYRTRRLTQAGSTLDVSIVSTALLNAEGQIYAIATTEREVQG